MVQKKKSPKSLINISLLKLSALQVNFCLRACISSSVPAASSIPSRASILQLKRRFLADSIHVGRIQNHADRASPRLHKNTS
ncbi:hypothetical protein SAY86_026170 [Trapa natans]|uniref:Uncharacterized protein n=1 Tax=Trapa natans TaxID=22666 RepID=A0AAN7QHE7_TRANT|nr:hypothetical protein SAY86_026170 [Trapa natans]